jgi:hypothetical protein
MAKFKVKKDFDDRKLLLLLWKEAADQRQDAAATFGPGPQEPSPFGLQKVKWAGIISHNEAHLAVSGETPLPLSGALRKLSVAV